MAAFESLLAGLIVLGCAAFSVWRLMSVRLRLRALDVLSRLPAGAGGRLAMALRRKTLAKLSAGGGCAACHQATHTHETPHIVSAGARPLNRRSGALRR